MAIMHCTVVSRDIEPSVEGGDRVWQVAVSCVNMYKNGQRCNDSAATAASPCCTTEDKEVFANVWSLRSNATNDALLSANQTEVHQLEQSGYQQVCNPIDGPTVFCVDSSMEDGRDGLVPACCALPLGRRYYSPHCYGLVRPFMVYSVPVGDVDTVALYRCLSSSTSCSCAPKLYKKC